MLAGSLQLEEPWYVEGAEFDSEKSEIHIHVGIRAKTVDKKTLFSYRKLFPGV